MKRPVHPVLHEVRQEHDRHELHHERQRAHPFPQTRQRRDRQNGSRRYECKERQYLHQQTAHEIIEQVFAPFLPKHMLLWFVREDSLQRNE